MNIRQRLIIMNFMEFGAWGAYLTSMGSFLVSAGLGSHISSFYAAQGIVSLFMPALMGIIADRWIPAQKLLALCHAVTGLLMCTSFVYCTQNANVIDFGTLYSLYFLSIGFFMPTIPLSYSVAYSALEREGLDTVKNFPRIRIFGTIGFILTMLAVDWSGFQTSAAQFAVSGVISLLLSLYSFTLPNCKCTSGKGRSFVDALGLRAFTLFKSKHMAVFFIFSMLLGGALQITNGYANPFISSFGAMKEYNGTFGVEHANTLISLSQMSETFCILLIPFFLKRFGIKIVVLISMLAWTLRFAFFGMGNPGDGVWLLVLSMIVYGVAFDFFNISGSLFVNKEAPTEVRSSAQGLFVLMTNGLGATIGTLVAGIVINHYTHTEFVDGIRYTVGDWATCWYIFAAYCLFLAIAFAILFKKRAQIQN